MALLPEGLWALPRIGCSSFHQPPDTAYPGPQQSLLDSKAGKEGRNFQFQCVEILSQEHTKELSFLAF